MCDHLVICGVRCFKFKPKDARLAVMDDFFLYGKRKVGMKFYIKSLRSGYYEEYFVRADFSRKKIQGYMDAGMVYVIN